MPITAGQRADIADEITAMLDSDTRWWSQGEWGVDDDGDFIEFSKSSKNPVLRDTPTPERCFCLGGAIRIATGGVLGIDPKRFATREDREIAAMYTHHLGLGVEQRDCEHSHIDALTEWNDHDERTYRDIHDLTHAVSRNTAAARPPEANEHTAGTTR